MALDNVWWMYSPVLLGVPKRADIGVTAYSSIYLISFPFCSRTLEILNNLSTSLWSSGQPATTVSVGGSRSAPVCSVVSIWEFGMTEISPFWLTIISLCTEVPAKLALNHLKISCIPVNYGTIASFFFNCCWVVIEECNKVGSKRVTFFLINHMWNLLKLSTADQR